MYTGPGGGLAAGRERSELHGRVRWFGSGCDLRAHESAAAVTR